MALEAVIFDMDGTLVDSMTHHILAWQKFLEEKGIQATLDEIREKGHGTLYDIMPRFFGEHISGEMSYTLAMEKEKIFRNMYGPVMEPLAGLKEWLAILRNNHIKIGLGTAADDSNTYFTLEQLNVKSFFDTIVTSDQVQEGKPSPKVYQYAARQLRVSPEKCLVFEDTFSGVKAAKSAGMRVAAVTTMHKEAEWEELGVDFIINDYLEVELSKINLLFA